MSATSCQAQCSHLPLSRKRSRSRWICSLSSPVLGTSSTATSGAVLLVSDIAQAIEVESANLAATHQRGERDTPGPACPSRSAMYCSLSASISCRIRRTSASTSTSGLASRVPIASEPMLKPAQFWRLALSSAGAAGAVAATVAACAAATAAVCGASDGRGVAGLALLQLCPEGQDCDDGGRDRSPSATASSAGRGPDLSGAVALPQCGCGGGCGGGFTILALPEPTGAEPRGVLGPGRCVQAAGGTAANVDVVVPRARSSSNCWLSSASNASTSVSPLSALSARLLCAEGPRLRLPLLSRLLLDVILPAALPLRPPPAPGAPPTRAPADSRNAGVRGPCFVASNCDVPC